MHLNEPFDAAWASRWTTTQTGTGIVAADNGSLHLSNGITTAGYTNAQITDYDYQTFALNLVPPLRLSITARAGTDDLHGTAGFGLWNHPGSPDARRFPRLPRAAWFFFGSPPGDLALAYGQPGHGWKAMTLDAARPRALAMIPVALPAVLLMQSPRGYQRLYPQIQRRLGISQISLPSALLAETHTYTIEWHADRVIFAVDDRTVLATPDSPRPPLGFIAWIDNQYAVATPQGRFAWGVLPLDRVQTLTLDSLTLESL